MQNLIKIGFCRPLLHQGVGGVNFAVDTLAAIQGGSNISIINIDNIKDAFKYKCDIYHFHGIWVWWFPLFSFFLKLNSIPYLISPHGMIAPWAISKLNPFKKFFFKIICFSINKAHSIIVASDYELRLVRPYFPLSFIQVIYFAADYEISSDYINAKERLNVNDDKKNLVYLSRISYNKGLDLLLSSVIDLPMKDNLRLFIIGDGDKSFVDSLKFISNNYKSRLPEIVWIGPVWDYSKWDYLQSADLFCLPTSGENFGFAILESLWVGTPVITSNFNPWKDLIGSRRGISFFNLDIESIRFSIITFFAQGVWTDRDRISLSNWTKINFSYSLMRLNYINYYRNLYEG
jgi:glycosyltransferase involved in cell wall biosynthesis